MSRRKRKASDPKLIAAKIERAEETGELDFEHEDVTAVLELSAARLAKTTADTSAAIEGSLQQSTRPPGQSS